MVSSLLNSLGMVLHFLFCQEASEYFESGINPRLFHSTFLSLCLGLVRDAYISLGKLGGHAKIPKRNDYAKGCLFSQRDAEFPRKIGVGVPKFLGKMLIFSKIPVFL